MHWLTICESACILCLWMFNLFIESLNWASSASAIFFTSILLQLLSLTFLPFEVSVEVLIPSASNLSFFHSFLKNLLSNTYSCLLKLLVSKFYLCKSLLVKVLKFLVIKDCTFLPDTIVKSSFLTNVFFDTWISAIDLFLNFFLSCLQYFKLSSLLCSLALNFIFKVLSDLISRYCLLSSDFIVILVFWSNNVLDIFLSLFSLDSLLLVWAYIFSFWSWTVSILDMSIV